MAHAAKAIELRPGDARSYANRVAARFKKGDVAAARADHDRAVSGASGWGDHTTVLVGRSIFRRNTDDATCTVADCDEALALDGGSGLVYLNRGLARLLRGQDERAQQDFDHRLLLKRDVAKILHKWAEELRELRSLKGK
jgi:hypothetical protein